MPADAPARLRPPPAPPPVPPSSRRYVPDKEDREHLDAIHAALDRMQHITPPDPYVLTIPQDVEPRYHHSARQWAEQWLHHTPFGPREHESLQYQTFHFYEQGKDMYVLHNSRPAEEPMLNGGVGGGALAGAGGAGGRARSGTGASTPSAGPKKKISLDAYKKKQTGAATTPERDATRTSDAPAKQGAVKGPIERVKAETEEILVAIAEADDAVPDAKQEKQDPAHHRDLKRKREGKENEPTGERVKGAHQPADAATNSVKPAAKKARTSDVKTTTGQDRFRHNEHPVRVPDPATQQKRTGEEGMPPRLSPGMPPRLSPGMPEKLSPLHKFDSTSKSPKLRGAAELQETNTANAPSSLPSRLSPTIPDNIEKTLEARAHFRSLSRSSDPSAARSTSKDKDGRLTPVNRIEGIMKRKSPVPRNAFRANSSSPAVRSDFEDRTQSNHIIPLPKSPGRRHHDDESVGDRAGAKGSKLEKAEQPGRRALLVRLKYKKTLRESIQRILKMRPRPDKAMLQHAHPAVPTEDGPALDRPVEKRNGERKDSGPIKGVAQKIGPVKKEKKAQIKSEEKQAVSEKRPFVADSKTESPATKRKRSDEPPSRREPSTPTPRELDSPPAQKSATQVTPGARKDFLSQAMRRDRSSDSVMTYATPLAQSSTPSINNTTTTSNSNSQSGATTNGFARPPSSQPSSKTPKQQAWETEQKRLEVLGRELKHTASDHLSAAATSSSQSSDPNDPKLAAVTSLESFLCYLLAFTCADAAALAAEPRQAPAYKTWRSLHGFFGFVKRTTEPFPPLCGLAAALGVVFSARIIEIATQFPADGPGRDALLETLALAHKAALDQDAKLDLDALQAAFPRVWARRSRKPLAGGGAGGAGGAASGSDLPSDPAQLAGPYRLPLGSATSPLRAARAGHAMLQEWIEQEKLDYGLRLKL